MAKLTKLTTADENEFFVTITIPAETALHIIDFCHIHEDYKTSKDEHCLRCLSLLKHLGREIRKAKAIQPFDPAERLKIVDEYKKKHSKGVTR